MQTDFTVQPWTFQDTTARVTCNSTRAKVRMDGAVSINVRLSRLIPFVAGLKREGFSTQVLENPAGVVAPDADWGKEHRVKLDNGVVTSFPRDRRADAEQYMRSLTEQGISFSYSFKL